jgi:two-component system, chemotaxis family, protein-glutamate methylesterase/glutaminase
MINDARVVRDLFVFGGSAGGLEALLEIVRRLPAELPATIGVVLRRSPVDSSHLTAILARHSTLPVAESVDGEPVRHQRIDVAPRDFHLTMKGERWSLDRGPKQHRMRPAIDPLFVSAAQARGNRVVGVLLSGGGADGVEGLIAITAKGGISLVQEPAQARQPSMPISAFATTTWMPR